MRSIQRRASVFFLILLSIVLSACNQESGSPSEANDQQTTAEKTQVERVLLNGNIYTFNWPAPSASGNPSQKAPITEGSWQADAQAVAINKGKIVAVGSNEDIQKLAGEQTDKVDLKGATVIPGFIDSHVHIAELGQILTRINLTDVATPEAAIKTIQSKLQTSKIAKGEWIIGQGWDEGAWANNYPDKSLLDDHFPDNPVLLRSLHGFAVWVNSNALEIAGIDKSTQPPVGGEIVKNDAGEPTGILLNRATTLIQNKIPEPTDAQFEAWVLTGLQQMANDGYVAVHQAGAERKHIKAFQSLREQNKLPIRVYAMLSARDKGLADEWIAKGPLIDPEGWLDIRSVKAYYDGALGSRGARLLEDYSDKPGHKGVAGQGYGFDQELVERLMASGFQVGIHAIGDAGNRETLDFIQAVYQKHSGVHRNRHRIEHAQVIHAEDMNRLAKYELIASMEPAHAVEDKTWAEDRLGKERIAGAYAWRSLIKAGTKLTLNSDLPGSDHSIFYGLHSAVTRTDKNFKPEGGWYSGQNLSIEEAIRGFTEGGAYAAFREMETAKIAKGYWADLTVIDLDIMNLSQQSPKDILNAKVLMTWVAGERVDEH